MGGDQLLGRIDLDEFEVFQRALSILIESSYGVYLGAEELHSVRPVAVRREYVYYTAPYAELSLAFHHFRILITHGREAFPQFFKVGFFAHGKLYDLFFKYLVGGYPLQGSRNRRHDYDRLSRPQRLQGFHSFDQLFMIFSFVS